MIPFETLIGNQTASDAVIVVLSILLALSIYKTVMSIIFKKP